VSTSKYGVWGLLLILGAAVRCNGTETDNPLASFQGSECHKDGTPSDGAAPHGSPDAGVGMQSAPLDVAGDYSKLACVVWDRGGTALHVSYKNFRSSCGIEWAGADAEVDGDGVRLAAKNPGCRTARCGNCFYDLDFDVPGVPSTGALHLEFVVTDENGKVCDPAASGPETTITLSADEPSDLRCRIIPGYMFLPPADACTRYGTCQDTDACQCGAGTTCDPRFTQLPVCVPSCTTKNDCPVPGAFDCDDGVCSPRPWSN
jgi:hypothetical protein